MKKSNRLIVLLLVGGCGRNGETHHEASMTQKTPTLTESAPSKEDIESHIRQALPKSGNRPDLANRDRATAWLLAHSKHTFPTVLEQARDTPTRAVLMLLARFDRAESTELLRALLLDPAAAPGAAWALGASSDPNAIAAAIEATRLQDPDVATAAIDGLGNPGNHSGRDMCPTFVDATHHASPEVRETAIIVGVALRCLDSATLQNLAKTDPDSAVRARAALELSKLPSATSQ
jgi:HEAT repeats